MKTLFYSILIIPFVIACGGEEAENEETTEETSENTTTEEVVEEEIQNLVLIDATIAGVFEIGKQVPEKLPKELKIRQFLEEDTDDEGNVMEHTHNVAFNAFEDVVELIMEKGDDEHHEKNIEEMMVLSNYYTTGTGVGVGTTAAEFQETYPDATVWYDKIHNRYYLETIELTGVQFIIEESGIEKPCTSSKDFSEINFSYLTVDAEIEKIRVF